MDGKKLEILMTAVDLGSLSKASDAVGYTQSGLTHLFDSLEREIGLTLIRRGHRGISLTRAGEELMPYIREFLRANANLENRISAITEQRSETRFSLCFQTGNRFLYLLYTLCKIQFRDPCSVHLDLLQIRHNGRRNISPGSVASLT